MKSVIAVLVFLASVNANAADWNQAFWFGLSHSGHTSTTVKNSSGTSLGTVDTDGKAAIDFGVESFRRTDFPINLTIIAETAWYGNDGIKNDMTTSLMVGPRVETGTKVNVWAEVGFGPAMTVIGTTSATSAGVTTTVDSGTAFSLAFSPRIGVDYNLDDKYFIGLQASYFASNVSVDGTVSSGSTSAKFSEDVSRHWMTTVFRFGYKLGSDDNKPQYSAPRAEAPPMPAPDTQPAAPQKIDADELMKLKKLRDAHAITEKEYQDQKAKLLK